MKVCQKITQKNTNITYICALPNTIKLSSLITLSNWTLQASKRIQRLISPDKTTAIIFSNNFLAVLNQANCFIGLAGTANEQALFLNKPVICFKGFGPQSTIKRFKEQQKLMGENLIICPHNTTEAISNTVLKTIHNMPPQTPNAIYQNAALDILNDIINDFS